MFTEGNTKPIIYVARTAEAPAKAPKRRFGRSLAERIADFTAYDEDDKCWHWKGSLNQCHGYPQVSYNCPFRGEYVTMPVHKALMENHLGRALGRGEVVCHATGCSKDCVNPHHHRVATYRENSLQAIAEGAFTRRGKVKRLTKAEILRIVELHASGMKPTEIIKRVNVGIVSVRDIVKGRRHSLITGLSPAPKSKGGRPTAAAMAARRQMITSALEAVI